MNASVKRVLKNGAVRFGLVVLSVLVILAILAPVLGTVDPAWLDAVNMNKEPMSRVDWTSEDFQTVARTLYMGTDSFGRDIYSRVLYGTRVSLIVGVAVAIVSLIIGTFLGLMAGYFRRVEDRKSVV